MFAGQPLQASPSGETWAPRATGSAPPASSVLLHLPILCLLVSLGDLRSHLVPAEQRSAVFDGGERGRAWGGCLREQPTAALLPSPSGLQAFNTFIDDVFAFIITMPTSHRLACFRDDVVFLVYLYQRW